MQKNDTKIDNVYVGKLIVYVGKILIVYVGKIAIQKAMSLDVLVTQTI
jgi:hypothetical protein